MIPANFGGTPKPVSATGFAAIRTARDMTRAAVWNRIRAAWGLPQSGTVVTMVELDTRFRALGFDDWRSYIDAPAVMGLIAGQVDAQVNAPRTLRPSERASMDASLSAYIDSGIKPRTRQEYAKWYELHKASSGFGWGQFFKGVGLFVVVATAGAYASAYGASSAAGTGGTLGGASFGQVITQTTSAQVAQVGGTGAMSSAMQSAANIGGKIDALIGTSPTSSTPTEPTPAPSGTPPATSTPSVPVSGAETMPTLSDALPSLKDVAGAALDETGKLVGGLAATALLAPKPKARNVQMVSENPQERPAPQSQGGAVAIILAAATVVAFLI